MAGSRVSGIGNLPAEVTDLVGRGAAVSQIRAMFSGSRLVTLTGMGGVGKTRLALRVGREVSRAFHDGVWFVELAAVHDPELVPTAVAGTLGIEGRGEAAALPGLASYLASREVLLVLDNCEHLVGSCAIVAAELLRLCPGVRTLATSREPLGVEGERIFAVHPLDLPAPGATFTLAELPDYPAVQMFVDRAAATSPRFMMTEDKIEPVVDICRRLDGIPLALELAATRLRALAPVQLQERLDDRFGILVGGSRTAVPRQQTLRALVDWSYELCTQMEQSLWNRLSVFQGAFDLAAAEAACSGEEIPEDKVIHVLAGLVDKSILTTTEEGDVVQYHLCETLREYAAERLGEADRAELRRRHVEWYVENVRQAQNQWFTEGQVPQLAALRHEHSNLRAALRYSLERPELVGEGLWMASALRYYWSISGYLAEGAHWLDRLLSAYPNHDQLRLTALRVRAILATLMGDSTSAGRALEDATDLAQLLDDPEEQGFVLQVRGVVALFRGEAELGTSLLEKAYRLHKSVGEESAWTYDEIMWALAAMHAGDAQGASKLLEDTLAVSRSHGANWTTSLALFAAGVVASEQGDPIRATALQQESIRLRMPLEDRRNIGLNLEALAWCAAGVGNAERAAMLFGAARRVEEEVGAPLSGWLPLFELHRGYRERAQEALGDEAYRCAEHDGSRLEFGDAVALALEQKAGTAAATGSDLGLGQDAPAQLTNRERQVAALVAEGLTNREIAAQLVISTRTVEAHVEHLLTKLNFNSRTQVATWVTRRRLGDGN